MLMRIVIAVPLILIGIVVGTACQHLGVVLFGERLGFELSSILGLAPFVGAIVVARHRWPRLLTLRRA